MNALSQYIDLYNEHRDTIASSSPSALNVRREVALLRLSDAALPCRGSEDYEATDLGVLLAPDYGVNVRRVTFPVDESLTRFNCTLPTLSPSPCYVVGDTVHPTRADLPAGVVVTTLRQAAALCPDVLEKHYGMVADMARDIPSALNTLLAQDGLLIYVPAGVRVEKPVQVINVMNAAAPMMAVRRLLIVLERDARLSLLLCDHTSDATRQYLVSQVTEAVLAPGASFDYYDMEESSAATTRLNSLWVRQAAGSSLLTDTFTLDNGTTRNDVYVEVEGEHCETRLYGMAIAAGRQHVDNHTFIGHRAPRCVSHEMYKYSLDDNAVGAFAGKILVDSDCPGVDAYQGNRNLCASPAARMYTKPQLEIYTDDVKCAHGSTIGQLDPDALFYMRQRGIAVDTAQTLLRQAFMSDIIDAVKIGALRERLRHLVERRFLGANALCNTCALSAGGNER